MYAPIPARHSSLIGRLIKGLPCEDHVSSRRGSWFDRRCACLERIPGAEIGISRNHAQYGRTRGAKGAVTGGVLGKRRRRNVALKPLPANQLCTPQRTSPGLDQLPGKQEPYGADRSHVVERYLTVPDGNARVE